MAAAHGFIVDFGKILKLKKMARNWMVGGEGGLTIYIPMIIWKSIGFRVEWVGKIQP